MIYNIIYSQLYEAERLLRIDERPILTVLSPDNVLNAEPEEFIETAKKISLNSRISVNIFERKDRIKADFYITGASVSGENRYQWEHIHSISNMYRYTFLEKFPETMLVSFVYIKKN